MAAEGGAEAQLFLGGAWWSSSAWALEARVLLYSVLQVIGSDSLRIPTVFSTTLYLVSHITSGSARAHHGFLGNPKKNSLLFWFSSHSCLADASCVSWFTVLSKSAWPSWHFFSQLILMSEATKVAIALHRTQKMAALPWSVGGVLALQCQKVHSSDTCAGPDEGVSDFSLN